MVVDDDADIRETIGMLLERHGFPVATASDGADALAQLRAGERPGLILLDLMMPRMNGEEFRRSQLSDNELAAIPVVVLSGAGRTQELLGRIDSGVEVLPKPIELTVLMATVRRFCATEKQ
jgi:two-component system, chemotaxis family, chemotaxis protein CheY